jgi:hypothetical protein
MNQWYKSAKGDVTGFANANALQRSRLMISNKMKTDQNCKIFVKIFREAYILT